VLRGETLREVYLVAELAGVAVAIACVVAWARRREPVTPTVIVVFALVGAELVSLFTRPWTGGLLESWSYVWPVHAVVYAAIAAVQGGALWSTKRR